MLISVKLLTKYVIMIYALGSVHEKFGQPRPQGAFPRGTQRQFSENICSEDDLRFRIFGTFVVKSLASLPLLGFSNVKKMA